MINKKINFKRHEDLKFESEVVKNCFIEVRGRGSGTVIGSLYQHPNKGQQEFLSDYTKIVTKIIKRKTNLCYWEWTITWTSPSTICTVILKNF